MRRAAFWLFLLSAGLSGLRSLLRRRREGGAVLAGRGCQLSFAPIVKRVAPAVVNVYASRVVERAGFALLRRPVLPPLLRRPADSGPPASASSARSARASSSTPPASSSPTITSSPMPTQIKVALSDRREFDCEVVLKDERTDLAVLQSDGASGPFPMLEFADSDGLEVGDLVLAIGDPFGVGQTVTSGIVSALARTQLGVSDYQFFIQTDAPINPGNSGGALIDMSGRLVGINTAIFSRTGDSNGLGFAIPSNMVRVVVEVGQERRPRPAALDRRELPGGHGRDRRGPRRRHAARRAGRGRRHGQPGRQGGTEDRRRRHLDRRRRHRRPDRAQLSAGDQGHRRLGQARHRAQGQGLCRLAGARGRAGDGAARRDGADRPVAARRRDRPQPLPGGGRGADLSRASRRASSSATSRRGPPPRMPASGRGDVIVDVNGNRSTRRGTSPRRPPHACGCGSSPSSATAGCCASSTGGRALGIPADTRVRP